MKKTVSFALVLLLLAAILPAAVFAADFVLGDVNGSGRVDAKDYMLLKRAVLKTYTPSADEISRGDVNGNKKLDSNDYNLVKRHCLGTYKIVTPSSGDHIKVNYHTHTARCNHAVGEDEDYVLAAVENGYDLLGFTDHVMLPWTNTENTVRGTYSESEGYYASVRALAEKYKGKIDILLGYECEWNESFREYYTYLLESGKVDYLVLGNHYLVYDTKTGLFTTSKYSETSKNYALEYLDSSITALESGLFRIFVHPDYFMGTFDSWDDDIASKVRLLCETAKNKGVALEINEGDWIHNNTISGGNRVRYPYDKFWDIVADVGCVVVCGVDAHEPSAFGVKKGRDNAFAFAKERNITITEDLSITAKTPKDPEYVSEITVVGGTGSAKLEKFGVTTVEASVPSGMAFDYWEVNGVKDASLPSRFVYTELGDSENKTYKAYFKKFGSYSYEFRDKLVKGENVCGDLVFESSLSASVVELNTSGYRGNGFRIADSTSDNTLTLKTNVPFKVDKLVIEAAMGSSNDTKITITVGGKTVCENFAVSNIIKSYSFDVSGASGELIITFTSTVKTKVSYIKSLSLN